MDGDAPRRAHGERLGAARRDRARRHRRARPGGAPRRPPGLRRWSVLALAAARTGARTMPARSRPSCSGSSTRPRRPRAGSGERTCSSSARSSTTSASTSAGRTTTATAPTSSRTAACGASRPGGPDPGDDGPLSRAGHAEAHLRALRPAAQARPRPGRRADRDAAAGRRPRRLPPGPCRRSGPSRLALPAASRSSSSPAASPSSSCGRSGASRRSRADLRRRVRLPCEAGTASGSRRRAPGGSGLG